MTVAETLLVFGGIPIACYLVIAAAVYGTASRHAPRYRPGRPFPFEPVWFVAPRSPHHLDDATHPALPPVEVRAALPAGADARGGPGTVTSTGGARGNW
ncbi:MAG: hypothetical protein ABJA34_12540 [Pseudonocardiales bacterium]